MTPAAVRKFALALEGTSEEPHFDRTSFRVVNRIYATMTPDGGEMMVKVPVESVPMWLESDPEVFFSYGKWTTNMGSLGVRLARVPVGLAKELLREAWERTRAMKPARKRAAPKTRAKRA